MKQKGFTLIEIMIALLVIGVLTTIAVNSYQGYILRSNRTDAMKLLLDVASLEENYYSFKYKYTKTLSDLGLKSNKSDYGYYQLEIKLSNNDRSYILEATPIGKQAADRCKLFQLYSDGTKKSNPDDCWR